MCATAAGSEANTTITLLLLLLVAVAAAAATTTTTGTTAAITATASAADNLVINNIIVKNNVDNRMTNISSNNSNNSNNNKLPAAHAHAANATTLTPPNANRKLQRGKRYLLFNKGSRMSWRTTVKNNILQVNTLWGYGFGFRANFPFPGIENSRRPFFKRDVLQAVADALDGHGLDGRACVLKSYCTALLDADSSIGGGMLFKILKLLFTLEEHERRHFPYLRMENCEQILHSHCPLSFDNISPYTDDV